MKDIILKVLREQTEEPQISSAEKAKRIADKLGIEKAFEMFGGPKRYIDIVYDGDIKEFYRNETIKPYYIKSEDNPPNMYFDNTLVQYLNLEDFGKDEKKLGKFKFGKNITQYSFDARLRKINYANGKIVWKVVGMSGSSGFGYSFINKRETIGKTYRLQIFKQIVDKYNLEDYK